MAKPINEIRVQIKKSRHHFSEHAIKRMIQRNIERIDVEEVILHGEIIEEYPEDKYSPSCLIYGKTKAGRNLHVQLSHPPKVVVVTTYEPDSAVWIKAQIRR